MIEHKFAVKFVINLISVFLMSVEQALTKEENLSCDWPCGSCFLLARQ